MLAQKLKETRKELGLTQKEFGDLLGISGNTIARYERDEMRPQHPLVLELAIEHLKLTSKTKKNLAALALSKDDFAARV